MQSQEQRLDDLLVRIGYQKGQSRSNSEEVCIMYYSKALRAYHQCPIGPISDILSLDDNAVKQLIEEKIWQQDSQIMPDIKPLSLNG